MPKLQQTYLNSNVQREASLSFKFAGDTDREVYFPCGEKRVR